MGVGALNYNLKVHGIEEYTYKLHLFTPALRDRIRKALITTSQLVVRRAKQLVPVDTGKLQSGIGARWSPKNPTVREVYADLGGDPARHIAAPVEYGRKKFNRTDAQPFLRPALAGIGLSMFAQIQDAIDAAVPAVGLHGDGHTGRGSIGGHSSAGGGGGGGSGGGANMHPKAIGFADQPGKLGKKHGARHGIHARANAAGGVKRHSRRFH